MIKKINVYALVLTLNLLLLSCLFTGCKSTQINSGLPEVEPLALLDGDSSIYVYVPVSKHVELVTDILYSVEPGISRSDSKLIAQHINNLYAGLATVKDRSRLQIAANGDFPPVAIKAALSKKNGWNKKIYTAASSDEAIENNFPNEFDVYERKDSEFKLSFCSSKVLAAAKNIDPLLEEYAVRSTIPETPYAQWISAETDDILVYITRPGQYLRNLIGTTITGCNAIYGSLSYAPSKIKPNEYSGKYMLSINIELSNPKYMRAWLGALKLAFGMMDGSVKQTDDLTIYVSNLEISEQQIIDMFTRDPITGKRFRVVGDQIITENY